MDVELEHRSVPRICQDHDQLYLYAVEGLVKFILCTKSDRNLIQNSLLPSRYIPDPAIICELRGI